MFYCAHQFVKSGGTFAFFNLTKPKHLCPVTPGPAPRATACPARAAGRSHPYWAPRWGVWGGVVSHRAGPPGRGGSVSARGAGKGGVVRRVSVPQGLVCGETAGGQKSLAMFLYNSSLFKKKSSNKKKPRPKKRARPALGRRDPNVPRARGGDGGAGAAAKGQATPAAGDAGGASAGPRPDSLAFVDHLCNSFRGRETLLLHLIKTRCSASRSGEVRPLFLPHTACAAAAATATAATNTTSPTPPTTAQASTQTGFNDLQREKASRRRLEKRITALELERQNLMSKTLEQTAAAKRQATDITALRSDVLHTQTFFTTLMARLDDALRAAEAQLAAPSALPTPTPAVATDPTDEARAARPEAAAGAASPSPPPPTPPPPPPPPQQQQQQQQSAAAPPPSNDIILVAGTRVDVSAVNAPHQQATSDSSVGRGDGSDGGGTDHTNDVEQEAGALERRIVGEEGNAGPRIPRTRRSSDPIAIPANSRTHPFDDFQIPRRHHHYPPSRRGGQGGHGGRSDSDSDRDAGPVMLGLEAPVGHFGRNDHRSSGHAAALTTSSYTTSELTVDSERTRFGTLDALAPLITPRGWEGGSSNLGAALMQRDQLRRRSASSSSSSSSSTAFQEGLGLRSNSMDGAAVNVASGDIATAVAPGPHSGPTTPWRKPRLHATTTPLGQERLAFRAALASAERRTKAHAVGELEDKVAEVTSRYETEAARSKALEAEVAGLRTALARQQSVLVQARAKLVERASAASQTLRSVGRSTGQIQRTSTRRGRSEYYKRLGLGR